MGRFQQSRIRLYKFRVKKLSKLTNNELQPCGVTNIQNEINMFNIYKMEHHIGYDYFGIGHTNNTVFRF